MTDLVHHLGQKLLPYSRNVFVIILLSFIFRVLLVAILIATEEFIVLMNVPHNSWLDVIREYLSGLGFSIIISEPLLYIPDVITKISDFPNSFYYLCKHILPLPVLWLICCIINRKILVDMPRKTFWFFAACQPYNLVILFIEGLAISLLKGKLSASLVLIDNILLVILIVMFPLLCWWGVERMRAKYLSEINE